jgi:phosphoenolpyruvate carboxylase
MDIYALCIGGPEPDEMNVGIVPLFETVDDLQQAQP